MIEPTKPPSKWPGRKSQLLDNYPHLLPQPVSVLTGYREPFCGMAALFFGRFCRVRPAVLLDRNARLITTLRALRDHPDRVIEELSPGRNPYTREHFEAVRARLNDPGRAPGFRRAADFLTILFWGFNGLYREAQDGMCNTPFGAPSTPGKVPPLGDPARLLACSRALQGDVTIETGDFAEAFTNLGAYELVYVDPPYHPTSDTADFTTYSAGGFTYEEPVPEEQHALFGEGVLPRKLSDWKRLLLNLAHAARQGAHWILSQADTPKMRADLAGYYLQTVQVQRSISSKAATRQKVTELLVSNRPFPVKP